MFRLGVFAVTIFGRDKRTHAPEGLSDGCSSSPRKDRHSERGPSLSAPATLTKNAGRVGILLLSQQEIEKADIYFSVYGKRLPFEAYFPAHVVADLENRHLKHPAINVVYKELQCLLRVTAPSASKFVEMATYHNIVSLTSCPQGGKDILFLDPEQQRQIREVEARLIALQFKFADAVRGLERLH